MEGNRLKILVTGGLGFIGTNLIKRLVKEGHKVICVDDLSTGKKENEIEGCIYHYESIQRFTSSIEWMDFEDPKNQLDIVYHLAAKARITPSFENPDQYFEDNIMGTQSVINLCLKTGAKLIFAGSSSHHSGKLKNPYTFSKAIAEETISLYQIHYNLKAAIARFYNVYGPHQLEGTEHDTLIGRWLYNIKNNIPCKLYGDGNKVRDFTHVDDIVDGLIKIMETESYNLEAFELGRGDAKSIGEIVEMFGITPIFKDNKKGEAFETKLDPFQQKRSRQILGWKPKINIEDYIKNEISSIHSIIH